MFVDFVGTECYILCNREIKIVVVFMKKRKTTLMLEPWIELGAKELDVPVNELLHRCVAYTCARLGKDILMVTPEVALEKVCGYLAIKVPKEIDRLGVDKDIKREFVSWLLEVALEKFKQGGVVLEELFKAFKEKKA